MNTDQRQILTKQTELLSSIKTNTSGGSTTNSNFQILKTQADDLVIKHTWLSGGTSDQRIDTIVYSSVTLGLTVTKTFTYYGGAGTYHVDQITLS